MTLPMTNSLAHAQGNPDSLTPVRVTDSAPRLFAGTGRTLCLSLFTKECCAMGIENPLLNFRVPQEIKDVLTLHASHDGKEVGPMLRQWVSERMLIERALELMKSVGLIEVVRRLSVPSTVMAQCTQNPTSRLEQTSDNFVIQGGVPVLQGKRA